MTLTAQELKSIQLIAEQLISYGLQRAVPIFTSTSKLKQLVPHYTPGAITISSTASRDIILGTDEEVIVHHPFLGGVEITWSKVYSLLPTETIGAYYTDNHIAWLSVKKTYKGDIFMCVQINKRVNNITKGELFSATMPNSYEALKQLSYLVHAELYSTLNS